MEKNRYRNGESWLVAFVAIANANRNIHSVHVERHAYATTAATAAEASKALTTYKNVRNNKRWSFLGFAKYYMIIYDASSTFGFIIEAASGGRFAARQHKGPANSADCVQCIRVITANAKKRM